MSAVFKQRFICSAAILFVFVLTAVVPSQAAAAGDPLTVHTKAGAVRGIRVGSVNEWRGVPYAAPPLGARRWRPPHPVAHWSGKRPARTFAPECAQLGPAGGVAGSENCLYLNVFAPAGTVRHSKLPVMVHLHG